MIESVDSGPRDVLLLGMRYQRDRRARLRASLKTSLGMMRSALLSVV